MRRFLVIGLSLMIGMACLSGCGQTGGDTTVTTTTGTAGESQAASETTSDAGSTDEIFVWDGTVIKGLTETGKVSESIVVPDTATEIGNYAFQFADMKSVTIGSGVTKIGKSAFEKCKELESVTIPASVQIIDNYAFSYCTSLKTITFSEGLVEIGKKAFEAVDAEEIKLPESLVLVAENAFNPCPYVENIYIPSSLENIPMGAFGLDSRWGKLHVIEGSWADLNYSSFVPADYYDSEKPSIEKAYY